MIIKQNKHGVITVKAQSKKDSKYIARFFGASTEIKIGDMVQTLHKHPLAPSLKFEVTSIETLDGQKMIGGAYGHFAASLVVKSKT